MDDRLLFLLSKAHSKLTQYLKSQFKAQDMDISPGQVGILFLLGQRDLLPMSELSNILEIDNSAITRLVDRLEKSGLVIRQPNPEDRRQYRIGITDKGMELASKAKEIAKLANDKIKEGFSDLEISVFQRVMASFGPKFG
ncbi:MAG: MarR family transcriptional regulator [Desulfosalsimonadaceae bacterium]|nr:MarR family transcriptional regulator [Desulfosalsimonadaceae bacterium]